jgi:hypothetical protein
MTYSEDIQVSIYGACNRPHLWEGFYERVAMTKLHFEIVFVTNVKPTFALPDNFRYIYSNVKPAQCNHIGAINSRGEVLMHVSDDCHLSPNCLDILYGIYKAQNDYRMMVAPRFFEGLPEAGGFDCTDRDCRIVFGDASALPVHIGGLINKQFYNELGGTERRFVFQRWDLDLQIRAQLTSGIKTIFPSNDAWLVERKDLCPGWQGGISGRYSSSDHAYYMSLWFLDGQFTGKRSDILEPYEENDTLLTVSQGPKGEWQ